MSRSLGLLISLFALILLLLSLFVFWIFTSVQINFAKGVDPFAECRMSKALGNSNIGGEFELINQDGQIVTDKDIFTEPTILYFGYTFCPDICPLDLYRNAEAVDLLDNNKISVTPVFVSIDPERDTPEVIGDFVKYHHPKMIGLTGSKDQIDHVSKVYKTYYKAQNSNDDLYLVDHSTLTYLILPEYGFVEFFRRDKSADEIANITACFIENS